MSSFFGSFYNGVAGLNSQAHRLQTISQNITNSNTIGYKPIDTQFSTYMSESGYSGNQTIGVRSKDRLNITLPGAVNLTNSPTDLAITGKGYFVVRNNPTDTTSQAYSREGNFRFDKDGNLQNASGFTLMGFPVVNGVVSETLTPINMDSENATVPPTATTEVSLRANVPADGTTTTLPATTDDPLFALGTSVGNQTFEIFDANGTQQSVTASFFRTGANEWAMELDALQGTMTAPGATTNDPSTSTPITFTVGSNGEIIAPTNPLQDFTVNWDAVTVGGESRPANTTTFSLDFNGIKQLSNEFTAFNDVANGNGTGRADRIFFDDNGFLTLESTTTGANNTVFQVALATFRGEQSLQDISGTLFRETTDSGAPDIGRPSTDGRGRFAARSLEASAVDPTRSFTDMIQTQKAYNFNSKVVSTVDDMVTRAIEMK